MESIAYLSPAKLNLFLHLTGRREDGYHNLETLFQLIDFCDTLTFSQYSATGDIHLTSNHHHGIPDIPAADNLIVRAAKALQTYSKQPFGCHIHIDKRIPMGGGLGGGSSNAATTLVALNRAWEIGLDVAELSAIAITLGADVPVFVQQHTAIASGLGEQLSPIPRSGYWYLLVIPSCHVNTATLFAHPELNRNTPTCTPHEQSLEYWQGNSWIPHTHNDFEPIARQLFPEIDNTLNQLQQVGTPRLTGTGACVFCEFTSEAAALEAQQQFTRTNTVGATRHYVVKGLLSSPAATLVAP